MWPTAADTGSQQSDFAAYLPGISDPRQAAKFLVTDKNIFSPDGKLKKNWTKEDTAQVRNKYNSWADWYKRQGGQPSMDKWLSLHKSDA